MLDKMTQSTASMDNRSSSADASLPAHPLGPLTGAEISQTSNLVTELWKNKVLQFKVITLQEPVKTELIPYLAAERAGEPVPSIDRRAFVVYYFRGTHILHEAIVNLSKNAVERNVRHGPFIHANGDGEELTAVEEALLAHPDVQAEIAKLQLPPGSVVVADPWIYGSDGVKDGHFYDDKRLMQCFLYMRDPNNSSEPDSCHYAFPLPISPVIDPTTLELIRIDILPTGHDATVKPVAPWQTVPPSEYIPEAQPSLRADLKPLQVVQPEGASFTVEPFSELGRLIRWQKWDLKVGFNQREGMVLYDVHYDGQPLFYRLSLSDMSIPYADPRHPFHRKAAFDLGDVGAGIMANNLSLGCDCLGSIYYISGSLTNSHGQPVAMPNVICVHEQDAGILWKHTNYRTNRGVVVRNRELVLQTILTVSNYEYILSFTFNTAGDVSYEARATGILSTQPVDLDLAKAPHPYGTVVHPGVFGAFHQHFFSLRIDPMVGGHGNAVVYDEAVPLPRDPHLNPHGVGYTVQKTPISTSGGFHLDPMRNRVFKIINPARPNPVNGAAVGYKIMVPPMQPMLADADSFHHKRAEFADKSVYVTRYAEGELYAGGLYTNQSRGGTGVRGWADRADGLGGGDPVVWVQFGINHVPRTEDFPVMPVETVRVMLRPVNFFERNPAMDVPPATQAGLTLLGRRRHSARSTSPSYHPTTANMSQSSHPTLINMPQPPSRPDTPSEAPGTPTSTTTSLSALSTTAIKDGHRGQAHGHPTTTYRPGHHHNLSSTSLEAERADRISRLTGLSNISALRNTPAYPYSSAGFVPPPYNPYHTQQQPQYHYHPHHTQQYPLAAGGGGPHMLNGVNLLNPPPAPAYFDTAGQPVAATKLSTVGSASATDRTSSPSPSSPFYDGSASSTRHDDDDAMREGGYPEEEEDGMLSDRDDADDDDDGSASLVGFGEGAGSTVSGPIYQRRLQRVVGEGSAASAMASWG
ncbi:copper amine oxidase, partial [Podospora conica]